MAGSGVRRTGFAFALAFRYANNPSEAEDIAQDALLRAWRRRSTLREPDRRNQWLATIVRNEAFRQHARTCPDPTATIELQEGEEDARVIATVECADLQQALDKPQRARPPAAGDALHRGPDPGGDRPTSLGIPEGTVKVRLHRARDKLRRVYVPR